MGNPRGNPGNKGGGRKSAYQEFLDAQWHNEKWHKPTNIAKLAKKISSGKYSVKDVYLYNALTGKSHRILAAFGDKILPDISMMIGAGGGALEVDLVGEAKRRASKWEMMGLDSAEELAEKEEQQGIDRVEEDAEETPDVEDEADQEEEG